MTGPLPQGLCGREHYLPGEDGAQSTLTEVLQYLHHQQEPGREQRGDTKPNDKQEHVDFSQAAEES